MWLAAGGSLSRWITDAFRQRTRHQEGGEAESPSALHHRIPYLAVERN